MVMSNRDRVDRGMGYLTSGLGPFVNERMTAAAPGHGDWTEILAARNPARHGAGRRDWLTDPRFLLRVLTEEWRAFRDHLSRVEQGFATELRDAGNRWAHGDPFSADDTYRTLDTMERLLTAVGAAEQASAIRALRRDLQQPAPGRATPPAAPHATPPSPPATVWGSIT
jgi:Swt1-like HEPN